jgi:hypothetical protein
MLSILFLSLSDHIMRLPLYLIFFLRFKLSEFLNETREKAIKIKEKTASHLWTFENI